MTLLSGLFNVFPLSVPDKTISKSLVFLFLFEKFRLIFVTGTTFFSSLSTIYVLHPFTCIRFSIIRGTRPLEPLGGETRRVVGLIAATTPNNF